MVFVEQPTESITTNPAREWDQHAHSGSSQAA